MVDVGFIIVNYFIKNITFNLNYLGRLLFTCVFLIALGDRSREWRRNSKFFTLCLFGRHGERFSRKAVVSIASYEVFICPHFRR